MSNLPDGARWKELAMDTLYDLVGSLIYGVGTICFIAPNNIAPGGASGVAIILNYLFGLPIGTTTFLINVPLLLLALKYLGRGFTIKTLRTVAINTIIIDLAVTPVAQRYGLILHGDNQRLLGALFGGVLLGAGLAVIFLRDSTTGGTDIAGRLLQLRYPHIQMGRAMMICDAAVLLVSIFVFRSIESGLYGLITIFVHSHVIDSILYGVDKGTMAVIVSKDSRGIAEKVLSEMDRGATLLKGVGAYSGEDKEVLLCAVRKQQFHKLKTLAYEVDPLAFIIVTEAGEIYGEGFKKME